MYKPLSVLVAAFLLCTLHASAQIIITYAGDTTAGNSGDGLAATNARINQPSGIATDDAGNLYIADAASNCIRKVNTAGIISTIAGTGVAGYNGDTIAATAAQLNRPISVATDSAGNVYISDYTNQRIRKVDPSGIITSVYHSALSPIIAPQTIVVNHSGVVYFSTSFYIYKVVAGTAAIVASATTVTGGDALQAPNGLAFDSLDRLYIQNSNGSHSQVLRMDTSGVFTKLAGNSLLGLGCGTDTPVAANSTWLNDGYGIARDDSGNIFYSDIDGRVMRINTAGITARYAGICGSGGHSGDGFSPLLAHIDVPNASSSYNCLAVNHNGDLFLAEPDFHCVRKVVRFPPSLAAPVATATTYSHISVSPSPNNGCFNITCISPTQETAMIEVTNMLGQKIAALTTTTNTSSPADLHLPPGTYILTAHTADNIAKTVFVVR